MRRLLRAVMALLMMVGLAVGITVLAGPASATPASIPYTPGVMSPVIAPYPEPVVGDFNGDDFDDPAVVTDLGNGHLGWIINNIGAYSFCDSGDTPLPGAYYQLIQTSLGISEAITYYNTVTDNLACYRNSNHTLYILSLDHTTLYTITFGNSGDQPMAGCFVFCNNSLNHDQTYSDLAMFRQSNGTTYILHNATLYTETYGGGLGASNAQPLQGKTFDHFCDPVTNDLCNRTIDHTVQRISGTNQYYFQCQSAETANVACSTPFSFGDPGDQWLTFDWGWTKNLNGSDGRSHAETVTLYRLSNHTFYVGDLNGPNGSGALSAVIAQQWGMAGDFAVLGNYAFSHTTPNAGWSNFTIYRPCTGDFWINNGATSQVVHVGPAFGTC